MVEIGNKIENTKWIKALGTFSGKSRLYERDQKMKQKESAL